MNIGFDARLYGTFDRGLGRYNLSLLTNLAQLDQVNKYWIFGKVERLASLPHNWTRVNAPWPVYSVGEQAKLPRLLKKYPVDLVHFPHFNAPVTYQRPYILTIHDMILHQFPNERATTLLKPIYKFKLWMYNYVFNRAVNQARAIITVSQATKKILIQHYPNLESKIRVVYEAPTIDGRIYRQLPRPIASRYLLYVGAAYPHKNLGVLVKAHHELLKRDANLKLVFVGRQDFFYQRLKKELSRYSKGVIFWGEATDATLAGLYAHADVYVSSSLAEGFNLSALEALSFGCPIVLSDSEVHREIFGPAALFAQVNQVDDYVKLVDQVLNQGRSGFEPLQRATAVLSRFSWQLAAQQTLEIYNQALV